LAIVFRTPASERMPHHFSVVTPGKLYRSGQPGDNELENVFSKYGIRTILLLRRENDPGQEAERRVAEKHGARIVCVPISSTQPLPPDMLARIRQVFANESGYPILTHCEYGRARTGVVVALWRIEQEGWTADKAVEEMLERGFPLREKNKAMREMLRRWNPVVGTSQPAAATNAE
jgi:protein tyrosine/serine phosphatase